MLRQPRNPTATNQAATAAAKAAAEPRWQPPHRPKREKLPPSVPGEIQSVRWNPDHKYLHVNPQTGQPIVPFKELLAGTTGDERRKLLWEISQDVKEYRRLRHARAVQRAAKRREKTERKREQLQAAGLSEVKVAGRYSPKSKDPEERWKAKVAAKKMKQQAGGAAWAGRGRRGASTEGRGKLFK